MSILLSNGFAREPNNGDVGDPPDATHLTIHALINGTTFSTEKRVVNRWGNANARRAYLLSVGSGTVTAAINDGSGSDVVNGATTVTADVWHAIGLRKNGTGAGALQAFLDGSQDGSGTSNRNINSPGTTVGTQFRIGQGSDGTLPFTGRIAEVAMWGVALSDAEMLALAKGVSPQKIRPSQIWHSWPLWDPSWLVDLAPSSRLQLVTTGSTVAPTLGDHGPVGCPFPVAA